MFSIGLAEVFTFVGTLIAAGWVLITLAFTQFEKRLDEKLVTLDLAVNEIKRLEIEIVRNDARSAQTYITKNEHDRSLERIFALLERMEASLSLKVTRAEVDRLVDSGKIFK